MNTVHTLRALTAGRLVTDGILGSCRLESGNVDAFGIEAVGDAFRRAPVPDAAVADAIEATGHLAVFGRNEAVVADLFGDAIGRPWRVGQGDPGTPEPSVSVAFDTDLRQARANVFVSVAEHPALQPAGVDRILALGHMLVDDRTPDFAAFRTRAFAVRTFGSGRRGCVLFAVHGLAPNPARTPRLSFAAARWDGATTQVVRDPIRARVDDVRIVS